MAEMRTFARPLASTLTARHPGGQSDDRGGPLYNGLDAVLAIDHELLIPLHSPCPTLRYTCILNVGEGLKC